LRGISEQPVDSHHEEVLGARQRAIAANRNVVANIFGVVRLLAKLCLPFRGHDEKSKNKGLFLEVIHFLAENGNEVLNNHLLTAPRNATYLGHRAQNEMIIIIGNAVRDRIIHNILGAKVYTIVMDETRDLSHADQVIGHTLRP